MSDDRQMAAATLAAAVFSKLTLTPEQDAVKEIMSIYKKLRRRLEAANASLLEEDNKKLDQKL